jgi:hypothetical protein
MKKYLIALAVAALSACVNPYRANFNTTQDRYPSWLEGRFAPQSKATKLIPTDNIEADGQKLFEQGYIMIGYSRFDHPKLDSALALQEGKMRGADIVLLQKKFSQSLTETVTMTQWGPSETTDIREDTGVTSGTETTHIDRRVSITTSRGPETVYVPQQVDYFEHSATFWRKVERPIFGASVRDLSDEQKKKLETNRGLVVRSLVIDSPAYAADILKDDVILRFDGEGVPSAKRFYEDLLRKAGKTVPVSILRGNKTIEKKVTLNP